MAEPMCICGHGRLAHVHRGGKACWITRCECNEYRSAVPDVPPVAAGGRPGGAVTPPRHDPGPPPSELDEVADIMRVILRDTDARRRSEHMETAVLAAAFALAFPGELSRRVLVDTLRTLRDDMPHGDSEDHR